LRLEDPKRSESDMNEWLRWCDADPENYAAFEMVQAKWRDLDALKIGHDVALTSEQKSELLKSETQYALARGRYGTLKARATKKVFAIAAGLAAIVLIAMIARYKSVPTASAPRQVSAALINRAATLPDGSKMILGVQSLVNMDFNGRTRQLDLTSGEAYFKVKHDKSHPFVVLAGEVSVTAIGTAFDVRRERDQVIVTVEEGAVEVRGSSADKSPTTWRAEAGYQLKYSTRRRTASMASVNPSAALAWRNGELAYLYEPLGSVVEDINRYSARKIVIADPEVASIPYTGTAWARSLDGWLAGVQQAYPVIARDSATGEVVLALQK